MRLQNLIVPLRYCLLPVLEQIDVVLVVNVAVLDLRGEGRDHPVVLLRLFQLWQRPLLLYALGFLLFDIVQRQKGVLWDLASVRPLLLLADSVFEEQLGGWSQSTRSLSALMA